MLWGELIEFPFSLALNRLKRRERNICEVWLRDEEMILTLARQSQPLKPVEDTWNFSGTHMRQSLRLSIKCEHYFFNSVQSTLS